MRGSHALLLVVALAAAACGETATEPAADESNLTVRHGVSVALSEQGAAVDGEAVVEVPNPRQAVRVGYTANHVYGAVDEDGHSLLRYDIGVVLFQYQEREEVEGESVFHSLDFGDATLAGEPMEKRTDPLGLRVHGTFLNYIQYATIHYERRDWSHDQELDALPVGDAIFSGDPVTLATSGGEGGEAFSATFRTRQQAAELVELRSAGESLPFETQRPVLSAGGPLSLSFDRQLDPDLTCLYLVPWPEGLDDETVRAGVIFGMLEEPSATITLGGDVLASALDALGSDDQRYILYVARWDHQEDVVQTRDLGNGEELSLPLVESHWIRMFVRVER